MQTSASAEPVDPVGTHHDFDLGSCLVQQGRRLQCTLTSADNDHLASRQQVKIALLRRMGDKLGWKALELWRAPSKGANSDGDDDATRQEHFSVFEGELEAPRRGFDSPDFSFVQIGHSLPLKPMPIVNESFKGHRT